jgi:transposase InsO family protein
MKTEHAVPLLCATLAVSLSGYYDWRQRQHHPGPRARADQDLRAELTRLHAHSRQTYGCPRLQAALRQQGRRHGRRRVARLMRQAGLVGRTKRRFQLRTTDSAHGQPVAPNRLATMPPATAPNQLWVADVTAIPTGEGWLYLAGVLDLFSRQIVGWATSARNDTALVLAAWQMAQEHRRPPTGLLLHSDRGSNYASGAYRQALDRAHVVMSMSRAGNCYDNAAMESFWSTLKFELVYRETFPTHAHAGTRLFDYMEVFYNRQRLHSSLGYRSPVDFELLNN